MSDKLEDIGEFVLVIGDFHSPMRNLGLPDCFKELLKTDKIKHVLCTGNVGCNENLELLKNIADSVHITKGDMDSNFDFPEKINIKIGDFKISLVHGHQIIPWGDLNALLQWQKEYDSDIIISGHTHKNSINNFEGKYFINPGSATGAFQPWVSNPIPSFILMAISKSSIVVYVYEEKDGKMNVEMSELRKQ
ncbi:vacuolar protein sorting-associated protein 29, putative [Plasmodium chabaudi chabaudi]|uniref:Vacuolar protein sorting-associated protein 29 n=2 Tax=Plasmodium chabaudi TaxID=5825 RepID=A0A077YE61_PLACU|nr:vacuolar protein sorting-associated protein 29, putative [Plasmodium chabaudi chabaudi]SCM03034.1 vacuolar protein sorting-associated protein 29, putative [Plasmodium chabaudi chabaudi]SCM05759.1 vacuolar protein sorting-associated protein 29, putative [Plasmodium chabaudi chabaudi]SCM11344.1 vacuolar protein sorting-associated protein 29, putative [Plasmodium chabaudi adami]VTZ66699.1 vacuolar protein sorting-associated protein 29, putative [Plasmodium chabaudi chabaudi]|eukprot:XP_744531.1 vacuolar protein sorting-associated protein 29, putative [Plasmodium chabaudi chabaudi]